MWFLYAELLVLLLVSYVIGCAVAAVAVRLVVRRTEQDVLDEAGASVEPATPPGVTP